MLKLVIQRCKRTRIPQAVCVPSEGTSGWRRDNPLGLVAFHHIDEQAAFIEPMKHHPPRLALPADSWWPVRCSVLLRAPFFPAVKRHAVSQGVIIHRLAVAVLDLHHHSEQRIAVTREMHCVREYSAKVID